MEDHICKEATGCTCYGNKTEPDDDCPAHGGGQWPARCGKCGKFIKREIVLVETTEDWAFDG